MPVKLAIAAVFISCFVLANCAKDYVVDPVNLKAAGYQKWAHYHFVWLHESDTNQTSVEALVEQYRANNIPVGAVNIDARWETYFNNFIVNTDRFSDFPGLVNDLHTANIKLIMWATSMVNVENPDYEMGVNNNYFIRTSRGDVRPLKYWLGQGALLDYSNPEAVEWWHQQMDKVLDVGVDGWKCDGTDPYLMEYSLGGGALGYNDQVITYKEYADMYYRDFFYHTRERRAPDTGADSGLIWSRPVDCLADGHTKGCWGFSPRDVMTSGWVGDDDATYQGLRGCLRKVIYSAWLGYANFACDTNGYRGKDTTDQTRNLFLRWTQAMTFLPLLENGGGGEHRPWMYDDEVVTIYRNFVVEHHRLSAYLHTVGANALDTNTSSVLPVAVHQFNATQQLEVEGVHSSFIFPEPSSFTYRLGPDLLVHPVLQYEASEAALNGNMVMQEFPAVDENESTVWLDWWQPWNAKKAHKAGDKGLALIPVDSFSVFVRQGALIPLVQQNRASTDKTDLTNAKTVFTWFCPSAATATVDHPAVYEMRESVTEGAGITATAYFSSESTVEVSISAHSGPVGFEFYGVQIERTKVTIDAWPTSLCLFEFNTLHCSNNAGGVKLHIEGVVNTFVL